MLYINILFIIIVIAAVAAEQNYIKQEDVVRLIQFRNNPADESWIGGNN